LNSLRLLTAASAILLASAVVVPSSGAAAATAQTNLQELNQDGAVQLVRERLQLPEGAWKLTKADKSEYRTQPEPQTRWSLSFSGPGGRETQVDVSARDHLIYSVTSGFEEAFPVGTITREAAQQRAQEALRQIAPEQANQYEFRETSIDSSRNRYTVQFERQVQGVYILDDEAHVEIAMDGSVARMWIRWHNTAFPSAAPKFPLEKARQSYRDTLDLRLRYADESLDPSVHLVYQPSFTLVGSRVEALNQPILDASDGKLLDRFGGGLTAVSRAADETLSWRGTPLAFSPDQADALVRSYGLLPADAKLQAAPARQQSEFYLDLAYAIGDDQIQIMLDKKTGELLSYLDLTHTTGTASLPLEQLRQNAKGIVQRIYGHRDLTLQVQGTALQENPASREVKVEFLEVLNGVPSMTRSLAVKLNKSTGRIVSIYNKLEQESIPGYYTEHDRSQYPKTSQIKTVEQATDLYLQNRPLRLSYLFPRDQQGNTLPPVLVYAPKPQNYSWGYEMPLIDAQTGELRPQYLYELKLARPAVLPPKMQGHWAEPSLRLFEERGVLRYLGGIDDPDRELTRAELVTLITRFVGVISIAGEVGAIGLPYTDFSYQSPTDGGVIDAYWYGWIAKDTRFRPNDKITREEAATIMSRVVGTQLPMPEDKTLPYADASEVSPWAVPALAQHNRAGLMRGDNTARFHPQDNITLAEVCTLLKQMAEATNVIPYDLSRLHELDELQ
jgi:hypothetical protein